jgi:hypothetical protein
MLLSPGLLTKFQADVRIKVSLEKEVVQNNG